MGIYTFPQKIHYFKVKKFSLLNDYFMVADCNSLLSLLDEEKYHAKMAYCFIPDKEEYNGYLAMVVKIPKRFSKNYVEEVLENMPRFASLRDYGKYEDFSKYLYNTLIGGTE